MPLPSLLAELADEIDRKLGRIHPKNVRDDLPVTIKVGRSFADFDELVRLLREQAQTDRRSA